ncbi:MULTISPECIES: hypothetical protein [Leptolyngbya]|uniref:hypothetical protein n=1 Tax=Leptolyngbya TaxID=47251 RepID=UPI0016857A46|nr:hypothetical protein [Leptolyngbya sp. FACHB-1624]MBD1856595.1 hypothetical protein [Leptolyngbya sp. FACHB-1624]
MPRLIGKRSNPTPALTLIAILAAAAAVSLEYFGYINVVPGFGRTTPSPMISQTEEPSEI